MSELRSQSQAVAVGSATSKHRQHQQHCRTTSLTSVAATVWQAVCARPSACRASRHAAWMQVSAVRQWEHACSSTSAALALGVAAQPGVHPRGTVSVPRWRSTSAAISQQPVGLFPPKFKTTQLVTRARWPWRSARATRAWADLHRSRKEPHDFSNPPLYVFWPPQRRKVNIYFSLTPTPPPAPKPVARRGTG